MNSYVKIVFVVLVMIFLSGCANLEYMPLKANLNDVDTSKKSILVGKLSINNKNKPLHHPELLSISIGKDGENYVYTHPTLIKESRAEGKEYFISIDTEPGKVTLKFMRFARWLLPLLKAEGNLHFQNEIDIPQNKIVYIGNIKATIKPRVSDEQPRAGPILPLVDQAVAGFSNGTFEVEVSDNYEADIEELRSRYPYLARKEIVKIILPQWSRQAKEHDTDSSVASME